MWGGLTIGYSTVNCPGGKPFGDWSIMSPKKVLMQVLKNIYHDVSEELKKPSNELHHIWRD